MIDSTSPSDRAFRAENAISAGSKNPVSRPGSDHFSAKNSAILNEALAGYPEIRPEVVARGRMLLEDPAYPSADVLRKIGVVLLKAPDLTADES
jgi:hypothetical protein